MCHILVIDSQHEKEPVIGGLFKLSRIHTSEPKLASVSANQPIPPVTSSAAAAMIAMIISPLV